MLPCWTLWGHRLCAVVHWQMHFFFLNYYLFFSFSFLLLHGWFCLWLPHHMDCHMPSWRIYRPSWRVMLFMITPPHGLLHAIVEDLSSFLEGDVVYDYPTTWTAACHCGGFIVLPGGWCCLWLPHHMDCCMPSWRIYHPFWRVVLFMISPPHGLLHAILEDLPSFLEGGCCCAKSLSWLKIVPIVTVQCITKCIWM